MANKGGGGLGEELVMYFKCTVEGTNTGTTTGTLTGIIRGTRQVQPILYIALLRKKVSIKTHLTKSGTNSKKNHRLSGKGRSESNQTQPQRVV